MAKEHGKRLAVVTGASAGIGAAFAAKLAEEGYNLIIVARSKERLASMAQKLTKKHQVNVEPHPADLTDPTELRSVENVISHHHDLDLLVNNAGFGTFGEFASLDVGKEEEEIRLNVVALVRLTRAALGGMVKRKHGAVINVSSVAGFQPAPFNATYAATKAFVNTFTESVHEELRSTGVYIQALCPGFTRTEFQERAGLDVSSLPEMVWMTAEQVVDASLAAMRRQDLICVPGIANRMLTTVTGILPRAWVRRVGSSLMRRMK